MEAKKLVILGSVNVDHILNVAHFPHPGETISGNQYQMVLEVKVQIKPSLQGVVVLILPF